LDRRREVREDAQICRTFKRAEAARPSVVERLSQGIGKVRGALGLVRESLNTLSAVEES
jgi:hypothetical protein